MHRIIRFRPTPAMVVASIALLVALGGVGYAATALPANSVGTVQLKNGAVTAAKVKPGSLLKSNFAAGQLPTGGPLAYAHVNADGTIDDALSKNVTVLTSSGTNGEANYCLKVTTKQAPRSVAATLDLPRSATKNISAIVGRDLGSSCQGDALVATGIDSATFPPRNAFYVVFFN